MASTKGLNPIDKFIVQAGRDLNWDLPSDRLKAVLAEARSHLEESAAEFVASGDEQIEAEKKAVTAFGSYKAWAKSEIEAFYVDPMTAKAGAFAFSCLALAIGIPLVQLSFNWFPSAAAENWALALLAAACVLGGFRARQRVEDWSLKLGKHSVRCMVSYLSLLIFFGMVLIGATQWVSVGSTSVYVPRSVALQDLNRASIEGSARMWPNAPNYVWLYDDNDNNSIPYSVLKSSIDRPTTFSWSAGGSVCISVYLMYWVITFLNWLASFVGRLVFRSMRKRKQQVT